METKISKNYRRLLALVLMFAVLVGQFMPFMPLQAVYAAQQNSYHDPAEHWTTSGNRTNELDANAVVTTETFLCAVCGRATQFDVWRAPEYTRDGNSDLTRNVKYSDGTMVDGVTKGNVNSGKPGVNAYYAQHHWTKAVCSQCGNFNTQMDYDEYCFKKNIYWLYDCAAEFMQNLDEQVSFEYVDSQYHKETREGGKYCAFCYGTLHNKSSRLVPHNMTKEVLPQLANQRFAIVSHCTDCDYIKYDYVAAKVVVADYYGVVDGQPHTITISDLSEAGVRASIRYGTSANNCTLTSAPNFTEAGQYTVYYEVTYKYDDSTEMVESGVAYVWLHEEREPDGGCACGCGDPNCDCQKPNCGGNCCKNTCGENHKFSLIESIKPTCLALGYDRYLCINCGKIEKRDYVDSLGHAMQQILIREATCEVDGKVLNICSRCGLSEVEYTPKGEHKYGTFNVAPTCTSPGYTVKECSVCGDRHITAMTNALPHDYAAHTVLPTCTTGGQTTYICEGCGSTFIGDHTEPLGHAWNEGEYIVEPTCAEDGIMEYTCTRCGATKRETVASGLHSSCEDFWNNAHKTALNTALNTSLLKAPVQNQVFNSANTVLSSAANTAYSSTGTKAGSGHVAGAAATCVSPQTCVVCGAVLAEATGHRYWQESCQPNCTEMGYTKYTCINCNQSYKSDYVNALGHNYSEQVTAPSCTQQGYTTYTCRKCGDSYVGNFREMTDHIWDSGTEKVNATCNGAGITEYHCKKCDAVRLETASASGHTPGVAATCTEAQLCTKCGAVLQNAKGHRLEQNVTAPTCTNIGYTTVTCKDCGLAYKTDYTDHLGHNYAKDVTAPTCLAEGYTTYTCTKCGDSYVSDYTEATGHKWDGGHKVVSPTCGGEGMTEYRCANCEAVRLENEAAAGHTPGKAATCTEAQICTDCGAILQQALGHKFVEKVTPATCLDMGYTDYVCEGCGYAYKSEYTKPLGHNYLPEVTSATCTEGGYTTFTCDRCGDSYVSDYTEATGHKWDGGKTVVGSACNSDGMTEYRCENCNEVRLEAESALGHTPGEAANCNEPQVCTTCGAILQQALGHTFKEEITAASCLDMGYTTFTCENCGFSYKTEYTKPTGHNYLPEVCEPTCLEKGYTTYTCEYCEDSYVADYTEPAGHKWDAGTKVINSVCNGEGMTEYRCESCGLHRLEAESPLGHKPGASATCTEPQICTVCNAILQPATGHDYVSKATAATCTAMGYTTFTCKYCSDSYTADYTDPTGHTAGEWIVDKQPTLTAEGSKHKACTKCGAVVETAAIERVYNQSVTDGKGEAVVGKYLVTVTDTDSKNPVAGAVVSLNNDDTISVNLPSNRLLDYAEQTTVKVQTKEDLKAVSSMPVSVTDVNKNYSAGKTDNTGQLIVPATSGNTNGDGVVTIGRTDDGVKQTLTVKVSKGDTNRPIKNAEVNTSKKGDVNIQLPEGVDMDEKNQILVDITDQKQQAKPDVPVTVKGDLNQKGMGETDKDGQLLLPESAPKTEKHSAYIVGYTDGTFRPEAQMTRAEASAIFARLLAAAKNENISPAKYAPFADTTVNAWYADYVNYLVGYGVIVGDKSAFRPNEDISRAELTAMAVRYFEVVGQKDTASRDITNNVRFNDVSGSYWAADYIQEAALYGWVQGYGNGSFKAEAKITRAEAVTLINNLLGRVADSEYIAKSGRRLNLFSDVYTQHWAYAAILEAANSHTAVYDNKDKTAESWNR